VGDVLTDLQLHEITIEGSRSPDDSHSPRGDRLELRRFGSDNLDTALQ